MTTVYVPLERPGRRFKGVESDFGMLASEKRRSLWNQSRQRRDPVEELEAEWQLAAGLHIIEIDNKSITHRPDLWGHVGMAREVAAISRKSLRDPVNLRLLPEGPAPIGVAIKNFETCARGIARSYSTT